MIFSSLTFIFIFLPLVFIIYWLVKQYTKNILYLNSILMVASLLFYAEGEPFVVLLMIIATLVTLYLGIKIEANNQYKNYYLTFGVLFNLSFLFYYKYLNFFTTIIHDTFHINWYLSKILLPIGISFYTFQLLSYLIDISRRQVKAERSYINFQLYISFFPQLIAGPIVRYKTIAKQLLVRTHSRNNFNEGSRRFMIGMVKKVVVADTIAVYVELIFDYSSVEHLNTLFVILGGVFFLLQLYFDFSGYSDMAIGMARMFGFRFNENFNYPYTARTLTEFWQRWHISLSTWFRDYLYAPIIKHTVRTEYVKLLTILVVFIFTGLWHGANYTFLVFGCLHGMVLIIERVFKINKLIKSQLITNTYLIIFFTYSLLLFRANDINQFIIMNKKLFAFDFALNPYIVPNLARMLVDYKLMLVVVIGFLFSGFIQRYMINFYSKLIKYEKIYLSILFIYAILSIVATDHVSNFLYFRF